MNIVQLLRGGDPHALRRTLLVTGLAGLANTVLLGLINVVAEDAAAGRLSGDRTFVLYLMAAGIYFIANRASLVGASNLVQRQLGALRLRLADKIRGSELRALERIGRGEIYAIVAQETNYLSQNCPLLVGAAQSLVLMVFSLLYIAMLSQIAFVVISLLAGLGLLVFWRRRARLNSQMTAVHVGEAAMAEALIHFTEGFAEIRLNADKNDALYRRFSGIVEDLEVAILGIGRQWVALLLFSNAFLYTLLGAVILILPGFFTGYTAIIYKIATAVIFCTGPITAITSVAHLYSRANTGLGAVFGLEARLDQGDLPDMLPGAVPQFQDFKVITFEAVTFRYEDAQGQVSFISGPLDLALQRGELVFVRGGNGGGKSTAMKLLCGLYRPTEGRILVDGTPVTAVTLLQYRALFSAIFTDFHLFDRLRGLETVDPADVRALIDRMELTGKVDFTDGRFSTLDLSTGQRKRLALIVSLLEDRPIYLLDEWAADQDAHFRDVFYTDLLPMLKRRGRTVVVVTHDERYWHLSDRIITIDFGAIVATERPV